jgi:hypothetical protein
MKRILVVSIVASALVSALITLVITAVVSPRPTEAQDNPTVVTAQRFVVHDAAGNIRAALGFDADGRPGLTLFGQDGADRAQLRLDTDGHPSFFLLDTDGTRRVAIAVNAAGDSILILREPGVGSGEVSFAPVRIRLVVRNNGATSIGIFDPGATPTTPPIWTAP